MKSNKDLNTLLIVVFLFLPLVSNTQVLFQSGQSLSTSGSHFEVVAVGDVNNDGLEDIVAGTSYYFDEEFDYKLLVFIQSESGTFPTTVYYPYAKVYPGLKAIDIEDVNNDSLNDVIIGYGDSIAIFSQNTSGTLDPWVSYNSGSGIQDLKVADINNDNLNDIVVCHSAESYIRAFYQTQSGFTSSVYAKPASGRDELEIGDVNSDGLNDVVLMVGSGEGGIHVFNQNASGTLNNYISYFPGGKSFYLLNGIAIGDLNNDGRNDIAASRGGNSPSASLVIWHQDTTTHLLKPPTSTPAYEIPSNIEIADFNCDGTSEIFMNHGGWNAITVWTQNAAGTYTDYDTYQVSVAQHPSPEGLTSGDIDHDGTLDIVAVGDFTTIQLLYNVSIPSSFTHIDTSVVIDTISYYIHYDYYFTTTLSDTISQYIITQTDSFLLLHTLRQDSVLTDSLFSRTGILCDSVYTDVITSTSYSYSETEYRDTSFWSTTTDTTFTLDVYNPDIPDIRIFPNPFSTQLTFQVSNNEQSNVALHDFLGQEILNHTFTNSGNLNTESIPSGIYIYKLYQGKMLIKAGKIVKP